MLFETAFKCIAREAVALINPIGNEGFHFGTKSGKDADKHGGGGDSVHVVVAEDRNDFFGMDGCPQPVDRLAHIGQLKRIRQPGKARIKKGFGFGWRAVTAQSKRPRKGNGQAGGVNNGTHSRFFDRF